MTPPNNAETPEAAPRPSNFIRDIVNEDLRTNKHCTLKTRTLKFDDLRDFIAQLETLGELKRIATPVSPNLEMTEVCDRVLRAGGPAILGVALNEVFVPLLVRQFPEIVDFYLPPEGCSYRMAVVSIRKQYPGHAKRVMFGIWSFLRQFMYTKFILVTDDDVDVRDWKEVIWAMTTRVDPARDTLLVENTPIDYLDFASRSRGWVRRWASMPRTSGPARPRASGASRSR